MSFNPEIVWKDFEGGLSIGTPGLKGLVTFQILPNKLINDKVKDANLQDVEMRFPAISPEHAKKLSQALADTLSEVFNEQGE